MSQHRSLASRLAPVLAAALVAGCTGVAPSTPDTGTTNPSITSTATPPGLPASPSVPPSATPEGASPTEPSPLADEPPAAALAAEGGDPVAAQLGTYTWGDAGSDSPWLPGAPATVGAAEPLTVTFDPPLVPDSWRALLAQPDADGPAGALALGEGTGVPTFFAPSAGRYTLALSVTVEGQGTAHYAWLLDVR